MPDRTLHIAALYADCVGRWLFLTRWYLFFYDATDEAAAAAYATRNLAPLITELEQLFQQNVDLANASPPSDTAPETRAGGGCSGEPYL